MTPKKKAEELIQKFKFYPGRNNSVESALICVNEIIEEGATQYGVSAVVYDRENFWYAVKEELENMK